MRRIAANIAKLPDLVRKEGRDKRPGLDQMLKDAQRRKFDVIMAWAIDRVGRPLIDLLGTIQTLEACGVDLYLDQQSIDTTTPAGKLMFQVCGAFAEFERNMIQQRIHAGSSARSRRAKRSADRKSIPHWKNASKLNCVAAKACARSHASAASAPARCSASGRR